MASRTLKILVAGSINGNWSKFFKKVNSINKKSGPFELLLCTGSTFGKSTEAEKEWQRCLSGELKVSVPTYVLGPLTAEEAKYYEPVSIQDGGELSSNVTYLGKKGIFRTLSGLSIAYVSGQQGNSALDKASTHFNRTDVEDLLKNVCLQDDFKAVDILVTDVWPAGITKYTNLKRNAEFDAPLISTAATKLKPRYHFSSSPECFFERPPYRNHQVLRGEQEHVTRFISLASFGNKEDQKAIYGFSITPLDSISRADLIKQPEDTTEFPFTDILSGEAVKTKEMGDEVGNFFFDVKDKGKRKHDSRGEAPNRPKKAKGPPTLSQPCWFCLGSPKVEKHLVVSIGEHCYLALPKGGLSEDHIMICPIEHHHSTVVLEDEALMEIEKYKQSLRKMFEKEGKELVVFERNFYTQHFQLQGIPVPKEQAESLKEIFLMYGEEKGLNLTELDPSKDLREVVAHTTPYFLVEFPSGERLLHRVVGGMPLQFGREVLASADVLNLPGKVNWKDCKLTFDEESELAKNYRRKFQSYDFNRVYCGLVNQQT